jgi:alkanesulfonate monooxygenase SsuD/methylene tetrahydromethanopterin reductase-like flavin-dependent oxidoreductase (luciferase family)
MRYGISVPCFVPEALASRNDPGHFVEWAKAAEAAGWDGFFVWDHMLFWKPDRLHLFDPWILATAMATQTERIKLGPIVTPLPRRRPWKVARETVSLDHLSNGRLILGVGLGAPTQYDFAPFGEPDDYKVLAEHLDEGLDVLTGLWRGEPFTYHGQHYQIEDVTFLPRPLQTPRIPIWVAAEWPRGRRPLRRAARFDGVVPLRFEEGAFVSMTADDLHQMRDYIDQHRVSTGPFDVVVSGYTRNMSRDEAAQHVGEREQAGATWWFEGLDWFSAGVGATPGEMLPKIEQGPPR